METEFKNQIDLIEAFKKALEASRDCDMNIDIAYLNVDLVIYPAGEKSKILSLTSFNGNFRIAFSSLSKSITKEEFQELLQMAVTKRQKKDTEILRNTLKI